jgi:hypothetical protein
VFATNIGTAGDVRNVGRWLSEALEGIGLEGSSKAFRHGAATTMLAAGVDCPWCRRCSGTPACRSLRTPTRTRCRGQIGQPFWPWMGSISGRKRAG